MRSAGAALAGAPFRFGRRRLAQWQIDHARAVVGKPAGQRSVEGDQCFAEMRGEAVGVVVVEMGRFDEYPIEPLAAEGSDRAFDREGRADAG